MLGNEIRFSLVESVTSSLYFIPEKTAVAIFLKRYMEESYCGSFWRVELRWTVYDENFTPDKWSALSLCEIWAGKVFSFVRNVPGLKAVEFVRDKPKKNECITIPFENQIGWKFKTNILENEIIIHHFWWYTNGNTFRSLKPPKNSAHPQNYVEAWYK